MQTFLPDPDFAETARLLDDRRLGKQRVEAMQILRALTRPVYGWKAHPAVLMWAGYEEALVAYALAVCQEWRRRGHADTVATTIVDDFRLAYGIAEIRDQETLKAAGGLPPWLSDNDLHLSHRSALVRKDPAHYRNLFPEVPDDLPYVWPSRKAAGEGTRKGAAQAAARGGPDRA